MNRATNAGGRAAPRDESARRRIREDLDTTLVVEAAAGTGKTTALVGRIAAMLRAGRAELDAVVAMTFTDKAAGELKLRLRAEIERARLAESTSAIERARLERALAALETAHIGTIHSFCLDLLRERPVEAGIDPALEVTADSEPLIARAFDRWYQRALDDPPEGLGRVLRRREWSKGGGPRSLLLSAARELIDRRDFPTPWRRDPFDRIAAIDRLVEQIRDFSALLGRAASDRDGMVKRLGDLRALVHRIGEREAVLPRDHDLLEHELTSLARRKYLWRTKGSGRWFAPGIEREVVVKAKDELLAALEAFAARAEADLAACLQSELAPVVAAYEREKLTAGVLDYLDMLIRMRDMLRDHRAVRVALQRRFSHLLVDEFQDTDPLQAEILLLLAAADPT